jgi:hypothetical protein
VKQNGQRVTNVLNKFEATLIIKALKLTRYSTKVHTDYVTGQVLKEITQRMEALIRGEKKIKVGMMNHIEIVEI